LSARLTAKKLTETLNDRLGELQSAFQKHSEYLGIFNRTHKDKNARDTNENLKIPGRLKRSPRLLILNLKRQCSIWRKD